MSRIVDFFKNLTAPGQEELSQEEVILNDGSLTVEEKKELIKTLKNTDTLAKRLWGENLKVAKNIKLTKNNRINSQVESKTQYSKNIILEQSKKDSLDEDQELTK